MSISPSSTVATRLKQGNNAMKLPYMEELNSARFLKEAFDPEFNERWKKAVRRRRNIYLWLFLTGMGCLMITAFTHQIIMSILSLFLATLSLVVMSKYDTQLNFLRKLKLREPDPARNEKPWKAVG